MPKDVEECAEVSWTPRERVRQRSIEVKFDVPMPKHLHECVEVAWCRHVAGHRPSLLRGAMLDHRPNIGMVGNVQAKRS